MMGALRWLLGRWRRDGRFALTRGASIGVRAPMGRFSFGGVWAAKNPPTAKKTRRAGFHAASPGQVGLGAGHGEANALGDGGVGARRVGRLVDPEDEQMRSAPVYRRSGGRVILDIAKRRASMARECAANRAATAPAGAGAGCGVAQA